MPPLPARQRWRGVDARTTRALVLRRPAAPALAPLVDCEGAHQAWSAANWVGNLCDPVIIPGAGGKSLSRIKQIAFASTGFASNLLAKQDPNDFGSRGFCQH